MEKGINEMFSFGPDMEAQSVHNFKVLIESENSTCNCDIGLVKSFLKIF